MKKTILIIGSIMGLFFSCEKQASGYAEGVENTVIKDSVYGSHVLSSVAAQYEDSARLFSKTARLDIEVENTYQGVVNIEKKVLEYGGYVLHSKLEKQINRERKVRFKDDSVRKYQIMEDRAELKMRVPQKRLHAFLISLNEDVKRLWGREVNMEELTFEYAYQQMEKDRHDENDKTKALIESEAVSADDLITIDYLNEIKNLAKKEGLLLKDKIEMADIEMVLREPIYKEEVVVLDDSLEQETLAFPFFFELKRSFQKAWYNGLSVILFLVNTLPFWLGIILLILLIRFYIRKWGARNIET